jgi:hypothetical protein
VVFQPCVHGEDLYDTINYFLKFSSLGNLLSSSFILSFLTLNIFRSADSRFHKRTDITGVTGHARRRDNFAQNYSCGKLELASCQASTTIIPNTHNYMNYKFEYQQKNLTKKYFLRKITINL